MSLLAGAEFVPLDVIVRHQEYNWRSQRRYVFAASKFYRAMAEEVGQIPKHLEELPLFPLTDKDVLRADQSTFPPFGSYLAIEPDRVVRLHRTAGTTGQAMNVAVSASGAKLHAEVAARSQRSAGVGPGDKVIHCLNYKMWMGGLTDHLGLEATGATVIPFGVGNTELLIATLFELNVDAISCTPSYPRVIEDVLAEQFHARSPKEFGLRLALMGGEPGLDEPSFRSRLSDVWGIEPVNANYGMSDVLCNFAAQCTKQTDLHFMALDVLYPELVDPDDLDPLPWETGTQGELVVTHLSKACQPLVRFRTGDMIELTGTKPCSCGRTAPRFRVIGRSDEMIVVRGVNVFPSAVVASLGKHDELNGEYRIVLDTPPPYHRLPVEAEVNRDVSITEDLEKRIALEAGQDLRLTIKMKLLPTGTLPHSEGKTRRVVRTYK